ncbi:hypothetical protein BpHYR1_036093 [Brachionus plicatilis]|uniref:Uncharacterized protein n=1 Tax=Brachionus plicatilis TaxID=10195 RepID=A0A3M7RN41_BRAPC|nr:hypothetical protein BpHYR1_036093 [Brachionus plicatilis]
MIIRQKKEQIVNHVKLKGGLEIFITNGISCEVQSLTQSDLDLQFFTLRLYRLFVIFIFLFNLFNSLQLHKVN